MKRLLFVLALLTWGASSLACLGALIDAGNTGNEIAMYVGGFLTGLIVGAAVVASGGGGDD